MSNWNKHPPDTLYSSNPHHLNEKCMARHFLSSWVLVLPADISTAFKLLKASSLSGWQKRWADGPMFSHVNMERQPHTFSESSGIYCIKSIFWGDFEGRKLETLSVAGMNKIKSRTLNLRQIYVSDFKFKKAPIENLQVKCVIFS